VKNLRVILGFLLYSFVAVIVTGAILNYLGIEHGSLLIKIGLIFAAVNVILYLLLLIFFVVRNLFHVYSEKKRKAIGSKFRTRLVVSFVGLVFIPSVLLFILSIQLINNSIDTWFSLEIQKPIYDSMDVAKTLYFQQRENAISHAALLASKRELLENNKDLSSGYTTYKSFYLKKPDGSALVTEAFNGSVNAKTVSTMEGDVIIAAAPVMKGTGVDGVVVVESLIPKNIVDKMESIQRSYNEYIQMKTQQNPVRLVYFMMLTIATLLIIFLALWISLRIAKSITIPIQSLAEATDTVTKGNLDFRIALRRDDEIGLLINSFNKMLDDIKEGKQSLEKAYKESDRRRLSMESILESINTGVIFFDRSGRILTFNNAACAMLNIQKDDLEGKTYKELLAILHSDELTSMTRRLSEKGSGSAEKEIHVYIGGRPMDLRVYMALLKDSNDNYTGTLAVFDNLTEIVMAQRALAWQEVAKRIAHEIKNPLTPIRLSAERLLKKWNEHADDFGEILSRSTKTIVSEVNSLRSLVDEFSRFGKMPKITLEATNIRSLIHEVMELYNDLRDVDISVTFNADIPDIEIDKKQIKMALINLIDNAVQARTDRIALSVIYNPSFDLIRIEIADEGVGIREEDRDKLFFPYFSTKKEGTGLGLAIVNSIISKHRGYIRVQDNDPKGTRFIIELPVMQK